MGSKEVIIVVFVILVIFGGKKLPELGRGIAEAIRQFRKSVKRSNSSDANIKDHD